MADNINTAPEFYFQKTAHDFSFQKPNGEEVSLAAFKGKVVLIVNTASKCGFTNQYAGLERLYQQYQSRGLVVIGVPSNDFGNQEPGTDAEIQNFCQANFGITFPIMKKTSVSGEYAHPFYVWAKKKLGFGSGPKWNFHKYIVDRDGKLVDYFDSYTSPENKRLVKVLEDNLDKKAE